MQACVMQIRKNFPHTNLGLTKSDKNANLGNRPYPYLSHLLVSYWFFRLERFRKVLLIND